MIISKQVKFDCAHMLSDYDGKCANLHGHTYHGTITLSGEVNPNTGMLIDYNEIKNLVDMFDHAVVFSSEGVRNIAEQELYDWASRYGMRHIVVEGKSTAENMAKYLADRFVQTWDNVRIATVSLSETDGSFAVAEAVG